MTSCIFCILYNGKCPTWLQLFVTSPGSSHLLSSTFQTRRQNSSQTSLLSSSDTFKSFCLSSMSKLRLSQIPFLGLRSFGENYWRIFVASGGGGFTLLELSADYCNLTTHGSVRFTVSYLQVPFLRTQERLTSRNKPARPTSRAYVTHKATFLKEEGSTCNTLLNAWADVVNQSTHLQKKFSS